MSKIIVADFDSAIDACIASYVAGFTWECVEFSEEVGLAVKLNGKQWDGVFDYKIAEFVVRLQKALVAAYNEQNEPKVKYNTRNMEETGLRVVVSVEPGCSWVKALFKGMWDNMDSKDKKTIIIAVAAVLAVPACVAYWHKCDTDAEIARISAESAMERTREEKRAEIELKAQERLQDEAARREAMHAIDRALGIAEQAVAPVAFLASKLNSKDTMTMDSVRLEAGTAKKMFRQR